MCNLYEIKRGWDNIHNNVKESVATVVESGQATGASVKKDGKQEE